MRTLIQDIEINSVKEAEEILKSAGTEDLFEKARTDGEMHPNGKWVWRSSANNGKGDWRVANPNKGQGSTSKRNESGNDIISRKSSKKASGEKTLQPLKSGSLLHYEDGEVWQVTKENKMKPYNELAKKNNISLSIEISKEGLTKVTNSSEGKKMEEKTKTEKLGDSISISSYAKSHSMGEALSNHISLSRNEFETIKKKYKSLSNERYVGGRKQEEDVVKIIFRESKNFKDALKNFNDSNLPYNDWYMAKETDDYAIFESEDKLGNITYIKLSKKKRK